VGYRGYDVLAADGRMKVCDIRGWGYLTGKGGGLALQNSEAEAIQLANARLIAAAPELYEALAQARQVLATYQPESAPTFYMEAIWNAEAALAKATGDPA
jgi:hypothetical protein